MTVARRCGWGIPLPPVRGLAEPFLRNPESGIPAENLRARKDRKNKTGRMHHAHAANRLS